MRALDEQLRASDAASEPLDEALHFTARVLFELPVDSNTHPTTRDFVSCCAGKTAIAATQTGVVRIVNHAPLAPMEQQELSETNETHVEIAVEHPIACVAFSNGGEYVAIADTAGALHLFRSDGELLFAYPVVACTKEDR